MSPFSSTKHCAANRELDDDCDSIRAARPELVAALTSPFDAFEAAWRCSVAEFVEQDFRILDQPVRLRVVGRALAQRISRSWQHLAVSRSNLSPALTISVWDEAISGVPLPKPIAVNRVVNAEHAYAPVLRQTADRRFFTQDTVSTHITFERSQRRMAAWVASANALPLEERQRPFQIPLRYWMRDSGCAFVHGGIVCHEDQGVLIAGPAGAGKTTTALMCLIRNWNYLGDDNVAVRLNTDGTVTGYGIFGSAQLFPDHLGRFVGLHGREAAERLPSGKAALLLSDVFPDRLRSRTTLTAIVLPRVVGSVRPHVSPARPSETLRRIMPSSLTIGSLGIDPGFDRLAELVDRLPRYWLDLGNDLEAIPDEVAKAIGERRIVR